MLRIECLCGNRQIVARVEKHIDGRSESPTSAVPENNNQLQRTTQVIHCVFQAAQHLRAQAVTCYADNEKIVWSLVENEFDGYAGVRTPEHCRERTLFGCSSDVRIQAQIPRIDRDDLLYSDFVFDVIEQRSEIAIAAIQSAQGCIAIRWQRPRGSIARLIPINDVDRFQMRLRYHHQPSVSPRSPHACGPRLDGATTADLI